MSLTIQKVFEEIDRMHVERSFAEHPLWKGLMEGTPTPEQLKVFAQQFSSIPLYNHNYHGPLYVMCPDPKWRERLAEVVYEEGTGRLYADGRAHNQLYVDFCKEIGLMEEAVWNAELLGLGATAQQAYQMRICSKSFLEGVSCMMLAGEKHGPGFFSPMADSMKQRYGLTEWGVAFWKVHDEADEDHSNLGRDLIEAFAKSEEDRQTVLLTVRRSLDMFFFLYDDTYQLMQQLN